MFFKNNFGQTSYSYSSKTHVPEIDLTNSAADRTRRKVGTTQVKNKPAAWTRLEVKGYLFLKELQPGCIEREPQNPMGVHQTPPFLGERHRERKTPY